MPAMGRPCQDARQERPADGPHLAEGVPMRPMAKVAATAALCVVGTVVVRHGPLEPDGTGERVSILLVWLGGLVLCARHLWTASRVTRRQRP